MKARLCLIAVTVMMSGAPAWAACDKLPAPVTQYLQANPQWRLVDLKDLGTEDQALWRKYRGEACPGFATVALDASKQAAYALALLDKAPRFSQQKAIVLRAPGARAAETVLVAARKVAIPFVIWRGPPGVYRDVYSRKPTRIEHDAIVHERMEATATAYYWSNGAFRNMLISD